MTEKKILYSIEISVYLRLEDFLFSESKKSVTPSQETLLIVLAALSALSVIVWGLKVLQNNSKSVTIVKLKTVALKKYGK